MTPEEKAAWLARIKAANEARAAADRPPIQTPAAIPTPTAEEQEDERIQIALANKRRMAEERRQKILDSLRNRLETYENTFGQGPPNPNDPVQQKIHDLQKNLYDTIKLQEKPELTDEEVESQAQALDRFKGLEEEVRGTFKQEALDEKAKAEEETKRQVNRFEVGPKGETESQRELRMEKYDAANPVRYREGTSAEELKRLYGSRPVDPFAPTLPPENMTEDEWKLVTFDEPSDERGPRALRDPFEEVRKQRRFVAEKSVIPTMNFEELKEVTADDIMRMSVDKLSEGTRERVLKARSEMQGSPFKIDGPVRLRDMRVDPMMFSNGQMGEDPMTVHRDLTAIYTDAEIFERGYDSDMDVPPAELVQIHALARKRADDKVLSIMGNIGTWNLLVLRSVEDSVANAKYWGSLMAPTWLESAALTGFGGVDQGKIRETREFWQDVYAPFIYTLRYGGMATTPIYGSQETGGFPVYRHGDSLSWSSRASFLTPMTGWFLDEDMDWELGGESGFGGKKHMDLLAYQYDPFQSFDDVRELVQYNLGVLTPEQQEHLTSPAAEVLKKYGFMGLPQMEDPSQASWLRKTGIPTVLTAATYVPYVLFDPSVANLTLAGAGKAFTLAGKVGGVETRAVKVLQEILPHSDEAQRLLASVEGKSEKEIREVIEKVLREADINPESTAGIAARTGKSVTATKIVTDINAGFDPAMPDNVMTGPSNMAVEKVRAGSALDVPDQVPGWQQRAIGPKHKNLAKGRDEILARQAREAEAAGGHASVEAAAANKLIADVRAQLAKDPEGLQLLADVERASQFRQAAVQRVADAGRMVPRARMLQNPVNIASRSRQANEVLLRAYKNKRALLKIAREYADKLGAARQAGNAAADATILEEYRKALTKLGVAATDDLGEIAFMQGLAQLDMADDTLDQILKKLALRVRYVNNTGVGNKLADRVLRYRVLNAAAQDANLRAAALQRTGDWMQAERIRATLEETFREMSQSIRTRIEGPATRTPFNPVWAEQAGEPWFNVEKYLDTLFDRFGQDTVRLAVDSTAGKIIGELKNLGELAVLGPDDIRQLKVFEDTLASTHYARAEVAPRAMADVMLNTVANWRSWPWAEGFDLALYQIARNFQRKNDWIGASAVGNTSKEVREVARRTKERTQVFGRELDEVVSGRKPSPSGKTGLDAGFEALFSRAVFTDFLWNRDVLLPAEKAYQYLKMVAESDTAAQNLVVRALAGQPVASGDAAEKAVEKAVAALLSAIRNSTDSTNFFDDAMKATNAIISGELSKTEALATQKMLLLKAVVFASSMYDGWIDTLRMFGAGLTVDAANALNYMQLPEASNLAVGNVNEALTAAAQRGLPLASRMKGRVPVPLPLIRASLQTDARLAKVGMDQGMGIYMPRSYVESLEGNEYFARISEEIAEFQTRGGVGLTTPFVNWWNQYKVIRIFGQIVPKMKHFLSNVGGGGVSQMLLERGGVLRSAGNLRVTAALASKNFEEYARDRAILQSWRDGIRRLSDQGSSLASMYDEDLARFIEMGDDEVVSLYSKVMVDGKEVEIVERMTALELRTLMKESGLQTSLGTMEMTELAQREKTAASIAWRDQAMKEQAAAAEEARVAGPPKPEPKWADNYANAPTMVSPDLPKPDYKSEIVIQNPGRARTAAALKQLEEDALAKATQKLRAENPDSPPITSVDDLPEDARKRLKATQGFISAQNGTMKVESLGIFDDGTSTRPFSPEDRILLPGGNVVSIRDIAKKFGVDLGPDTGSGSRLVSMDLSEKFRSPAFDAGPPTDLPPDEPLRVAFASNIPDSARGSGYAWVETTLGEFRRIMSELDSGSASRPDFSARVDIQQAGKASAQAAMDKIDQDMMVRYGRILVERDAEPVRMLADQLKRHQDELSQLQSEAAPTFVTPDEALDAQTPRRPPAPASPPAERAGTYKPSGSIDMADEPLERDPQVALPLGGVRRVVPDAAKEVLPGPGPLDPRPAAGVLPVGEDLFDSSYVRPEAGDLPARTEIVQRYVSETERLLSEAIFEAALPPEVLNDILLKSGATIPNELSQVAANAPVRSLVERILKHVPGDPQEDLAVRYRRLFKGKGLIDALPPDLARYREVMHRGARANHLFKTEVLRGGGYSGIPITAPDDIIVLPSGNRFTIREIANKFGVELGESSPGTAPKVIRLDLSENFAPSLTGRTFGADEPLTVAFPGATTETTLGDYRRIMSELDSQNPSLYEPATGTGFPDGEAEPAGWARRAEPLYEPNTVAKPTEVALPRERIPSTDPADLVQTEVVAQWPRPVPEAPGPRPRRLPALPKVDARLKARWGKAMEAILGKMASFRFYPQYMEEFARGVEATDSAQRTAYYLQLRFHEKIGHDEALSRTFSRFGDWSGAMADMESRTLGRLMMVWRFQRVMMRQLGENVAMTLTEAGQTPWRAAVGETPVGRMLRTYRGTKLAEYVVDWRDDDEKVGDQGLDQNVQDMAWGEVAMQWWFRLGPHIAGPAVDAKDQAWFSDAAGRNVTQRELMFTAATSLDQLYTLNALTQTFIAMSVAGAEGVGVDTGYQTIGSGGGGLAGEIAERAIDGFGEKVDPILSDFIQNMTNGQRTKRMVTIPKDQALVIKRMMNLTGYRKFGTIRETPDGEIRTDWGTALVLDLLTRTMLANDVAYVWGMVDTPELASGEFAQAVANAVAQYAGIYTISGFDPRTEWDYDVSDRGADLRGALRSAEAEANKKKDRR